MLRNRVVIAVLALALLVGARLVPLPHGLDRMGIATSPSPQGSQGKADVAGAARPAATAHPVAIDPQLLQRQAAPFLVLRAATLKPGAALVVGGQCFQPFEELAFSIRREGERASTPLGTAATDKDGALPDVSFALPEGLNPGSYTVVATPVLGGPPVEASFRVDADSTWVRLTSTASKPNELIGFEGGGFAPGETVNIYLDSLSSPAAGSTQASQQGGISGSFQVPLAGEGDHNALFYGEQSRTPATVGLFLQGFRPWVMLDNYAPTPEQSVGFAGSDFAPGERVFIFLNDLDAGPVAVVEAGPDGTFKAPRAVTLGPQAKGAQKLLFVGDESQVTVEADFTVQPYPASLELTVYAGPPGCEVAFNGNGFARGEEVRAYLGQAGSDRQLATFRADDNGAFSGAGRFRIPTDSKAGNITLSVLGQVSGATASVTFAVLPIKPWVEVKQTDSGKAAVLGHGFAPGEAVELTVGQSGDSPPEASEADRDGNAHFTPIDVPVETAGPVIIRLRGRESGGEAKAEYYAAPVPEQAGQPTAEKKGSTLEFEPVTTPSATATVAPLGS